MSNKLRLESVIIKIILIVMLLIALFKLPYAYYQILKIVAFVGFGYLAFEDFKNDIPLFPIVFLILALIFSPIFKLYLGRTGWNIVDLIAALILIYSIIDSKYLRNFYE